MKNDYLWDRSGEPDPEIQELEEVLGTLRYQPQPLELPPEIRPERQRKYFSPWAIAAAIALMILAAGLWARFHRSQRPGQSELAGGLPPVTGEKNTPPVGKASPTSGPGTERIVSAVEKGAPGGGSPIRKRKPALPGNSYARNVNTRREAAEPTVGLTEQEREEAIAAKEQLMLALRLASAKLNFAQRKTQGVPAPGAIRNQHKVG